jgi:hypothetical protein
MLRVSESHSSSLEDGRARAVSTKSICYCASAAFELLVSYDEGCKPNRGYARGTVHGNYSLFNLLGNDALRAEIRDCRFAGNSSNLIQISQNHISE